MTNKILLRCPDSLVSISILTAKQYSVLLNVKSYLRKILQFLWSDTWGFPHTVNRRVLGTLIRDATV